MRISKKFIALVLMVGVLLPGLNPAHAQEQASRYFNETGHWVSGDFLQYYESVKDPLLLFGYPITEAFQDSLSGRMVQYFQRARFELYSDAPAGQRVRLSPLGEWLLSPGEKVPVPIDPSSCVYFPATGHNVCYTFLEFFNKYSGAAQFGEPLSEIEKQDNLYVQYFRKARFEWHPELPSGQRVTVADLGSIYFDQRVGDPGYLAPVPRDNIPQSLMQVKARAFVSKAVTAPNDKQTLFVIAYDQYYRPVTDAGAEATLIFPAGSEEHYRLPATDAYGLSQLTFAIGNQLNNQLVRVLVTITSAGRQTQTETWFHIWW
jgi:hypothetical protein